MEPLLSIVIPTRNRQQYCIAAIEDILSYEYTGMELCIQDNSDDDQIEQYITHRSHDPRLKYKRIPQQIASIFNINDSIKLATGKYVIVLGDDDTILPNIFKTVEWANEEDIDSICPTTFVEYLWPGAAPGRQDGLVIIPSYTNSIREIDIPKSLHLLFSKGIVNYLSYKLPKVYHGIVLRERLLQIEKKTGHFFCGLSPDISGCIALSTVVIKHRVVDYPISVAGACKSSTTAQNIHNGHRGELQSAPHLHLRGEYHWDPLVPPYYSVETIWADSALHATQELNISDLRDNIFNFYELAAYAILRNRSMFKFALMTTINDKNNPKNKNRLISIMLLSWYASKFCSRKLFRMFFKNDKVKSLRINGINDIRQAVETYQSTCSK